MEPTSHQPFGSIVGPDNGLSHSANTSSADSNFSTTAAHATGGSPYPTDASAPQSTNTSGVKAKLDNAVESSKKWLSDSGVAEQAQQLPQKAKELGNKALTGITGLTTTQKAVAVGLLAAGVAFLATRGNSKKPKGEYRDRPRKSPFDHQPHTKDGDHAYDRKGQRPWGNSRYGAGPGPGPRPGAGPGPAGKHRVSSGSGYTSSPASSHSNDLGRQPELPRHSAPAPGQRRDQGPASGSRYDANTSGSQNPNNSDQLNSAY